MHPPYMMTTKTNSSSAAGAATTEFLSWRNTSSPNQRCSSLLSATNGTVGSKPSSPSTHLHPFATNLGDPSPALLRRLSSSLPDEIFLGNPNDSSLSSIRSAAAGNDTFNHKKQDEDEDSISLGSYKEFYKDLPVQVIPLHNSCSSSISGAFLPSSNNCSSSVLTSPLQRSTTLQQEVLPTTPKVRRTTSRVLSPTTLALDKQHKNLTKLSSSKLRPQQQGNVSTPMTLATTVTDFSSASSVEGLPPVPFLTGKTRMKLNDPSLAFAATEDDASLCSSSCQQQQHCQASQQRISHCSDRFQVAVRLRPCCLSSEDVSSSSNYYESERSGASAQPQRPLSPSRLRGWTRRFSHTSKASAWEIQPEPATDDGSNTVVVNDENIAENSSNGGSRRPPAILVQKDVSRPVSGRHLFSFDAIYSPETSTDQIYQETAKPVVRNVLNGKHGTIFAYGPTGSGKTFTMQGGNGNSGTNKSQGIVLLAARDLLGQLQASNQDFELHAQFVEIYNEQIRDLLAPPQKQQQPKQQQQEEIVGRSLFRSPKRKVHNNNNGFLALRDERLPDGSLAVTIPRAKQVKISSINDVTKIVSTGHQNRATAATALNAQSSRSHAIFRLLLTVQGETDIRHSVLNLVDLAGSENSTQASITGGLHKRETGKINQSLLSLSRVIHALSLPPSKRPKHIGYRDSKLTRMLQPHLSGNACIAVLCCVSTARRHLEETRSALKFAASAKRIQVQPVVNSKGNKLVDEQHHAKMLLSLQKELKETKESLRQLQAQLDETRCSAVPAVTIKSIGAGVRPITPDRSIVSQTKTETVSDENWTDQDAPLRGHVFDTPILIDPECDSSDDSTVQSDKNSEESYRAHETDASSEAVLVMDSTGELDAPMDIATLLDSDDIEGDDEIPLREVTIMIDSFTTPAKNSLEQLENAQERAAFLAEKLEATDDLVESLFKELRAEQSKNAELLNQIVKLEDKIERLEVKATDGESDLNLLVQQCMLLKYGIAVGLGMFACGQEEGFLVAVLFLWLTLAVIRSDEERSM